MWAQQNWFTNVWLYDPQNLRDIDAALHLVSQELRRQRMPSSRYEICLDIDTEVDDETKETVKLGCYYMWDKDAEEVCWLQETVSSFFYDGLDVKILGREHLSTSLSEEETIVADAMRYLCRTCGGNGLLVIISSS